MPRVTRDELIEDRRDLGNTYILEHFEDLVLEYVHAAVDYPDEVVRGFSNRYL